MNVRVKNKREKRAWINSQSFMIIVIFLAVTFGAGMPRAGIPYTWDDTLAIVNEASPINSNNYTLVFSTFWYDDGDVGRYYRPLAEFLLNLQIFFCPYSPFVPSLLQSILLGATTVSIYLLALELTRKKFVALGAAIFSSLSIPALAVAWVVLHNQTFAPFFIVLGLLGYVRYVNHRQLRWLSLLWICDAIGPFFREIVVLLPLTVLGVMLAEGRWDKPLLTSLPIMLAHSFFPSFLPNFLFFGRLVVTSIYRYSAAKYAQRALSPDLMHGVINLYTTRTYIMPFSLGLFIPPILTGLAMVAIMFFVITNRKRLTNRPVIAIFILIMSFFLTGMKLYCALPLIFFFLVPLMSFKFGKLLPIWFLVSGLPFFILYERDAHLWTASIPWIIMILLWVDELLAIVTRWASSIQHRRIVARLVYLGISVPLLIGFADQGLNVVAVYTSFSEIAEKNKEMGEWFLRNAPEGSMVVTNFQHGADVEYFAYSKVKHYPSEKKPFFPMPQRELYDRLSFEKAVRQHYPQRDVYLLTEIRFPHKYINEPPGDLELVAEFTTHCRYPFLDPLKNLVPKAYWHFAGPPDLLVDFAPTGGLFYRELTSTYCLYKLTNYVPRAIVIKEGYKDFDVVFYDGDFYGIPKLDGRHEVEAYIKRIKAGESYPVFCGGTVEEVIVAIDNDPYIGESPDELILVVEGYRGFNIVANRGVLYAILQTDGAFDYHRLKYGPYTVLLRARTLQGIKISIDEYMANPEGTLTLLKKYKGFVLINAHGTIYAVPQSDNPHDEEVEAYIKRIKAGESYPVFCGGTVEEVIVAIDNDPYIGESPDELILVVEGYRGFNIVANRGVLYAILQTDGAFDYHRLKYGPYTVALQGRTLDEVKKVIDYYVEQ